MVQYRRAERQVIVHEVTMTFGELVAALGCPVGASITIEAAGSPCRTVVGSSSEVMARWTEEAPLVAPAEEAALSPTAALTPMEKIDLPRARKALQGLTGMRRDEVRRREGITMALDAYLRAEDAAALNETYAKESG